MRVRCALRFQELAQSRKREKLRHALSPSGLQRRIAWVSVPMFFR